MQNIVNKYLLFFLLNYPQKNLFHIDKIFFFQFRFGDIESDVSDAWKVWYYSIVRHYLPHGS